MISIKNYYYYFRMRGGLLHQDHNRYTYKEQNPQYKGEPLDYSLASGPSEQRKCRDLLFVILYSVFWVASIVIAIIAFNKGDPSLLATPFDSTGYQCGRSLGYQQYPYAYFNQYNISQFTCINQCPQLSITKNNKCRFNNTSMDCNKFGSYKTIQFVHLCLPTSQKISEAIDLGLNFFDQSLADLKNTWQISLTVLFMALLTSLLICGGCLVFAIIILYFVAIMVFGILCFQQANHSIDIEGLKEFGDADTLRTMGAILFTLMGLSLLVVLCTFRRIKTGIMIIKTAASFVQQQCQIILIPVFMFIAIAIFFVFWITVSVFIFSSGHVGQCRGSPYACIQWDVGVKRSLGLFFFGLFWNSEIVIGICQYVIASATAYWYFSHLNHTKEHNVVCRSFCRALTTSLGSIIFGALLLCIFFILQLIFQILHRISKQQTIAADPATNAIAKCCISYTRCCLACFQRFIRFISRNAFIFMAISGDGFCSAAHQSFYLVFRSSMQYAISHGAGSIIMLFGKLLITSFCTLIGYLFITRIQHFSQEIFNPFMPCLMFLVISFVVSSLFMDVFATSSDTLLICYAIEKDILRGVSRACPNKLRALLDRL